MVRTKSTTAHMVSMGKTPKVAACKASSSAAAGPSSTSDGTCSPARSSNRNRYSGGNPIHPREIPAWQKTITCFFPVEDNERPPPPPPPPPPSAPSLTDGDKSSFQQEINNQPGSSKD